jgi:dolichol kinase
MRYGSELVRKAIHFGSLAVPVGLHYASRDLGRSVVLVLALGMLTVDVVRLQVPRVRTIFYFLFGRILRDHERFNLLGSTYLLLSALICAYAFPKSIAVAALAFLVIGDTLAALVGRRWGRTRILDKSLEGSLACFLSCLLAGWLVRTQGGELSDSMIWLGALVATVVELLPIPLDDNMRIPLAAGFVMMLVG